MREFVVLSIVRILAVFAQCALLMPVSKRFNINTDLSNANLEEPSSLVQQHLVAFFDPSTIGRTARPILFLAIVGGQSTNTYIMNNAVGDIRTRGMPTNILEVMIHSTNQ